MSRPIWTQKSATKFQPANLYNPESILPSSLVSYAKSVDDFGEKELTTLKMTVLSSRSPARSALKERNPSLKKKNSQVLFTDFVVEKEKNDIYLTRMSFETENSEWKSKLIVERHLLDKLTSEVHGLITRLRNSSADAHTIKSRHQLHKRDELTPPKRQAVLKITGKTKRQAISKIFGKRIIQLIGPEECIYEHIELPDWNKYLPGIFSMLNAKRDILLHFVKESQQGGGYIINLFNQAHTLQSHQVSDIFEYHQDKLLRCCAPMTLKNGKIEIWNSLLDKFFRQFSGKSVFKTRDYLQAIVGLPVKQQNTYQIQMLADFVNFYTKNGIVMTELKNGCCFVQKLKTLNIDGQHYQFVVVASFETQNIQCSLKHSPLFQKCSYLQRIFLKDLERDYRMLVLLEDFKYNFPKLLVTCSFGTKLAVHNLKIGKNTVAFIESDSTQNIVLRITTESQAEIITAMAQLYQNKSDVHFRKKVKGHEIIYHKIGRGYYEVQTSETCRLEIFCSSELKIVQEELPQPDNL